MVAESNTRRDPNAKRLRQEKEIFADPVAGNLSEPVEQEKETKEFADAQSIAGGIAITLGQSDRNSGGECIAKIFRDAFAEEKRRAGHDFIQRDRRL
ncbi:MAG TPA: hypothetical protein VH252_09610 [Chthoniobacterales bacterium]|nr:hypothetical protein [Chthoniobacterales bacterium]